MEQVESLDQWPAQEDREKTQGPNLMNTPFPSLPGIGGEKVRGIAQPDS